MFVIFLLGFSGFGSTTQDESERTEQCDEANLNFQIFCPLFGFAFVPSFPSPPENKLGAHFFRL
jgi:hypothetical protein